VTGRIKLGTESNGGFRNITISNCTFEFCRGLALETVDGAILEDISVSNITMKEVMGSPFFLDPQEFIKIPACAFYIRHARNVEMSNILIKLENQDFRPAFIFEDVKGVLLFNVRAPVRKDIPSFFLKNVSDFKTILCGDIPDKKKRLRRQTT
jgi:polygalacturonase